jgi:hypothetical protein
MKRKVFFSFHYDRDAWRAGQVRNSNVIPKEDTQGFTDSVPWEEIKRNGDGAIKEWILDQLEGTSVTVVLIGAQTAQRDWVNFEICKSWEKGNAIIGLYIHGIKDEKGHTDTQGVNPLDTVYLSNDQPLSSVCSLYDWVLDNGRDNLGKWADKAVEDRNVYTGETALITIYPFKHNLLSKDFRPTIIRNPPRPWGY